MSLDDVKSKINADKNGITTHDLWTIFRLARFEGSLGCLLNDNAVYEQKNIIEVYNTVREADSKLVDVKILTYADIKTKQQVQIYFYKNRVMYIILASSHDHNLEMKSMTDKYGNPVQCGSKYKEDYFITGQGAIKLTRYSIEYFNIPLCKEHADAMRSLAKNLTPQAGQ